jgi:hypothetical protein
MSSLLPENYDWGICITHDVDHLSHNEHSLWEILKFQAVCKIETFRFKRSLLSFMKVIKNSIFTKNDSWDCIEEMIELDFKYAIPSTFFFAMHPGRGLKYTREQAREKIKKMPANFEIGVHGQFPNNEAEIKNEFADLYNMISRQPRGIRMHYLKTSENMREYLKNAGYTYDSTEFDKSGELKQAYKTKEGLVEIPIHLMDTYMFSPFYDNLSVKKAKAKMEEFIANAKAEHKIINIIIHQRSISEDLPRQKEFYEWLVQKVSDDVKCWKTSCKGIADKLNGN